MSQEQLTALTRAAFDRYLPQEVEPVDGDIVEILSLYMKSAGNPEGREADSFFDTHFSQLVLAAIKAMEYHIVEVGRWCDENGWNIEPTFELDELLAMEPEEAATRLLNDFDSLLDLSNGWAILQGTSMNDHGEAHAREVYDKVMFILEQLESITGLSLSKTQKLQLVIAVILHDIGMSVAGREGHEKASVLFVRQIPGWDPEDEFCKTVEHLMLYHVTSNVKDNLDLVRKNQLLSLVIMGDEMHLENRVVRSDFNNSSYDRDPWVRLAADTYYSYLTLEIVDGKTVAFWNIYAKDFGKDTLTKQTYLEMLDALVFMPKFELYQAALEGMLEEPTELKVRVNQTTYDVNAEGIVLQTANKPVEIYNRTNIPLAAARKAA